MKMRLLDRKWNQAVNTILSLYRGLQYKLPGKRYTDIEADFLKTHYAEFGHHIPWQVHTFCAMAQRKQMKTFHAHIDICHKLSCKSLLCTRTCSTRLSIDNYFVSCLKPFFLYDLPSSSIMFKTLAKGTALSECHLQSQMTRLLTNLRMFENYWTTYPNRLS